MKAVTKYNILYSIGIIHLNIEKLKMNEKVGKWLEFDEVFPEGDLGQVGDGLYV